MWTVGFHEIEFKCLLRSVASVESVYLVESENRTRAKKKSVTDCR